jgi:hypothetical protein
MISAWGDWHIHPDLNIPHMRQHMAPKKYAQCVYVNLNNRKKIRCQIGNQRLNHTLWWQKIVSQYHSLTCGFLFRELELSSSNYKLIKPPILSYPIVQISKGLSSQHPFSKNSLPIFIVDFRAITFALRKPTFYM